MTATPLPKGEDEVSLNGDVLVIDRGVGPQVLPNPEVGLRWGISEDLDLGGRVNAGGVEANAKWRFVGTAPLDVALVPGIGFGFVPVTNADSGLFNANAVLGLLAGVEVAGRSQLVIGARGVATYAFPLTAFRGDASGASVIYLPGGALGFRFPVGESTYLFPDVNVLVPYDSSREEWYFPTLQGGVALQLE